MRAAIPDLERHGNGVAAFIVDSAFTSDGIYTHPTTSSAPRSTPCTRPAGCSSPTRCSAASAGSATRLWGYQRHGVDPDIVTLGKPMGNGFPVAGLAVAHDVVADFGHDVRYFNTFGGNTVADRRGAGDARRHPRRRPGWRTRARSAPSCAPACASSGSAIRARSATFAAAGSTPASRSSRTGDQAPDGARAAAIVNALRERRVLISATGRPGNVLKIRPPLVFSSEDAALFLEALENELRSARDRARVDRPAAAAFVP